MADETDKAEPSAPTCLADPNFAVICSFFDKFSESIGLGVMPFTQLQEMLEDQDLVPQALIDLHVKLLRKARKSFTLDKWERALTKFAHSYSQQDGWELERFGYKKSSLGVKLRLLKTLLEAQFDVNVKFKNDINKLTPQDLRIEPLGRDAEGLIYWCQFDPACNVRVYREDVDEETWDLVAQDRHSLVGLIDGLSSGEGQQELDSILNEEEACQESEKPVTDTGQDETIEDGEEAEEEEDEVGEEEEESDEEGSVDNHQPEDEEDSKNDHKSEKNQEIQMDTSEEVLSKTVDDVRENVSTAVSKAASEPISDKDSIEKNPKECLPSVNPVEHGDKKLVVDSTVEQLKNKEQQQPSEVVRTPVVEAKPSKQDDAVVSNKKENVNCSVDLSVKTRLPSSSRPGSKLEEIFKMKMERPPYPYHDDKTSILSQMAARFNNVDNEAEDLSIIPVKKPRLDPKPKDMTKTNEGVSKSEPVVSEAIEEKVMIIRGDGSGADCNAGNPFAEHESKNDNSLEVMAVFTASSEEAVRDGIRSCIIRDAASNDEVDVSKQKERQLHKHSSVYTDSELSYVSQIADSCPEPALPLDFSVSSCDSKEFVFEASEAIEEDVMYFSGCGAGRDCDTGNPGEAASNKPSTSAENTDVDKKGATIKLWSIDNICKTSDESKCSAEPNTMDKQDEKEQNGPNLEKTDENPNENQNSQTGPPVIEKSSSEGPNPAGKPSGVENGQTLTAEKELLKKRTDPVEKGKKSVFLSNIIEVCLNNKPTQKDNDIDKDVPSGSKYQDLFSAKNIHGPSVSAAITSDVRKEQTFVASGKEDKQKSSAGDTFKRPNDLKNDIVEKGKSSDSKKGVDNNRMGETKPDLQVDENSYKTGGDEKHNGAAVEKKSEDGDNRENSGGSCTHIDDSGDDKSEKDKIKEESVGVGAKEDEDEKSGETSPKAKTADDKDETVQEDAERAKEEVSSKNEVSVSEVVGIDDEKGSKDGIRPSLQKEAGDVKEKSGEVIGERTQEQEGDENKPCGEKDEKIYNECNKKEKCKAVVGEVRNFAGGKKVVEEAKIVEDDLEGNKKKVAVVAGDATTKVEGAAVCGNGKKGVSGVIGEIQNLAGHEKVDTKAEGAAVCGKEMDGSGEVAGERLKSKEDEITDGGVDKKGTDGVDDKSDEEDVEVKKLKGSRGENKDVEVEKVIVEVKSGKDVGEQEEKDALVVASVAKKTVDNVQLPLQSHSKVDGSNKDPDKSENSTEILTDSAGVKKESKIEDNQESKKFGAPVKEVIVKDKKKDDKVLVKDKEEVLVVKTEKESCEVAESSDNVKKENHEGDESNDTRLSNDSKSEGNEVSEKPKGRKSRTNSLNVADEVPSKVRKTDDEEAPTGRRGTRRLTRSNSSSKPPPAEDQKTQKSKKKEPPKSFTLSSFSLEEPVDTPSKPVNKAEVRPEAAVSGGKRKRDSKGAAKSEDDAVTEEDGSKAEEEVGGKKPRLKAKVKKGGKRKRGRGGFRGLKKSASEETKEDNESKDEDCDETKVDVVEDQKQEGTADLEGDKTEYESDDDVPLAKRGRGPTKTRNATEDDATTKKRKSKCQ